MAVTKTLIESYVGDTIQRTINVTLNGNSSSDNDMTDWSFKVELDTASPIATAIPSSEISVNDDNITEGQFMFSITDEQTGALSVGRYKLYGKLVSPVGDEFTVLDSTVILRTEGVA